MENELFYVGHRELFEKPGRRGYTTNIKEAGKFSLNEAKSMTKYADSGGYGRWYIACTALDSFDGENLKPTSIY